MVLAPHTSSNNCLSERESALSALQLSYTETTWGHAGSTYCFGKQLQFSQFKNSSHFQNGTCFQDDIKQLLYRKADVCHISGDSLLERRFPKITFPTECPANVPHRLLQRPPRTILEMAAILAISQKDTVFQIA